MSHWQLLVIAAEQRRAATLLKKELENLKKLQESKTRKRASLQPLFVPAPMSVWSLRSSEGQFSGIPCAVHGVRHEAA
jgi:hypothetical protein